MIMNLAKYNINFHILFPKQCITANSIPKYYFTVVYTMKTCPSHAYEIAFTGSKPYLFLRSCMYKLKTGNVS